LTSTSGSAADEPKIELSVQVRGLLLSAST
jgi:hypothetical protein